MLVFAFMFGLVVSATAKYHCGFESEQSFVYQVPQHTCGCNAKSAGVLRYHDNKLQYCNGVKFVDVGEATARQIPVGSKENPGASCRQILAENSEAASGSYYLKLGGDVQKTYCFMGEMCGSKGWTMIMKINGAKTTFGYTSAYWTNQHSYNVDAAAGGLDNQETKLSTYSHFPLTKLCLGMKRNGKTNWMRLEQKASSLYSLIADNKYRATHQGRNAWKNLIPGSSLQPHCNKEGFNAGNAGQANARIGIASNQENNCGSPDSRIGFGTGGGHCGQNDKNSAGNEARCSPDNGDKSIQSFGYIFAQERVADAPLGSYDNPASSCKQVKAVRKNAANGIYHLKSGDGAVKTYCYMGTICGAKGWTMIMKINGGKNTFQYKSAYWSNKVAYNEAGATGGLDGQETKLSTYWDFSFDNLCLGMKTNGAPRWMKLKQKASSLYSLIADGKYRATHQGRNAWKNLIPGSSLQPHCNREGFNAGNVNQANARIGIASNQENNCGSPDSRIGFGTGGGHCGQNDQNSAGNEARCSPDNGDKSIKGVGFIFAQ